LLSEPHGARLVQTFGEAVVDLIEQQPERLREVPAVRHHRTGREPAWRLGTLRVDLWTDWFIIVVRVKRAVASDGSSSRVSLRRIMD
jgi:hypothetical protein